jgi:hypothetical protein
MSARLRVLAGLLVAAGVFLGQLTHATDAEAAQRDSRRYTAKITVVDHTAGTWPGVREVARAWGASRYLQVRVADSCKVRTYCVTVEAAEYGATPWHGQTMPTGLTSATLQLNLSVPADATLQSAVMCHELGHAIGIAHPAEDADRPGVHGCIASTDPSLTVPLPSAADLAQARAIARADFTTMQGTPQQWGALWVLDVVGKRR